MNLETFYYTHKKGWSIDQFPPLDSEPSLNGNVLSIAISCVGRRLILAELTEEELDATVEFLPDQSKQIGFYSYGEISPYGSGACELHNQTMTLTTISEV